MFDSSIMPLFISLLLDSTLVKKELYRLLGTCIDDRSCTKGCNDFGSV